MNNSGFRFTKEQRQFIFDNYKNITTYQLQEMFNKHFNSNIRYKTFRNFLLNNHLKNDVDTRFKKGEDNLNYKPNGYERVYNHMGLKEILVKVDNCKYETKQRLIYKEKFGNIPNNHTVIFLDGNRNNFNIDNLALVSKKQVRVMCLFDLFYNDKELTKTGIILANLKLKVKEVENE